jgi:inorganic pyrophosphatase
VCDLRRAGGPAQTIVGPSSKGPEVEVPRRTPRTRGLADPSTLSAVGPERDTAQVLIETPKGSRNKYAFNRELRVFELTRVLPAGMAFPYDFGFVPSTVAGDGDPVDVLVLMDQPAFPGCLLACRLVGIIRGEQRNGKQREENNRLIAVEIKAHDMAHVTHLDDLGKGFVKELEDFFINYHELDDRKFEVLGTGGPTAARKCVKQAARAARHGRPRS